MQSGAQCHIDCPSREGVVCRSNARTPNPEKCSVAVSMERGEMRCRARRPNHHDHDTECLTQPTQPTVPNPIKKGRRFLISQKKADRTAHLPTPTPCYAKWYYTEPSRRRASTASRSCASDVASSAEKSKGRGWCVRAMPVATDRSPPEVYTPLERKLRPAE